MSGALEQNSLIKCIVRRLEFRSGTAWWKSAPPRILKPTSRSARIQWAAYSGKNGFKPLAAGCSQTRNSRISRKGA